MLVLTRTRNQSIRVGHHVSIRVLGVEGGYVRIGVVAPRDVPVDREEIFLLKRRKSASQPSQHPARHSSRHSPASPPDHPPGKTAVE